MALQFQVTCAVHEMPQISGPAGQDHRYLQHPIGPRRLVTSSSTPKADVNLLLLTGSLPDLILLPT
jgi:hypothetical protein